MSASLDVKLCITWFYLFKGSIFMSASLDVKLCIFT